MTATAQAELFDRCPVAGCSVPVEDPRTPCPECLEALGPWIRPAAVSPTAEEFAAVSRAGDQRVAAVLAERRAPAATPAPDQAEKRNQRCWVCEERRTCAPDPDRPQQWICRGCTELA